MPAHLHAGVRLMHELEQLVDDRLEELPVVPQEARVLPHNIPAQCQQSSLVSTWHIFPPSRAICLHTEAITSWPDQVRTNRNSAHDVGRNDCLVVLAARDLAQIQQVPDDSDQEPATAFKTSEPHLTTPGNAHTCLGVQCLRDALQKATP